MQVLHVMPWVRVSWWTLGWPEGSSVLFGKHVQEHHGLCLAVLPAHGRNWSLLSTQPCETHLGYCVWCWIHQYKRTCWSEFSKVALKIVRHWGISDIRRGWENWAFLTWRTEDSGDLIIVYISSGRKEDGSHSGIQDRNKDNRHTLKYWKFLLNKNIFFSCAGAQTPEPREAVAPPSLKLALTQHEWSPEQPAVGRSGTGLQSCHPASVPPQF